MSYDRQLDQVCPHFVVDEALFVSDLDRRTVRPLKQIASTDSVKVRLNGALEVPAFGALLPAQTTGSKLGPFNITPGVNDRLVVSVDQGPNQTVVVPGAKAITAEQLVRHLNVVLKGVVFSAVHGRVAFRSAGEGRQASVFVRSSSTLAPLLGIPSNREYRGMMTAPGWTLVTDPVTLLDRPVRLIVFDAPVKDYNAYVEITYNTVQQECRRCRGLGVENDWRYGQTGEVSQVSGEALLIQEFQKLVYTVRTSNRFHEWYGTAITEVIGQKLGVGGIVQSMIVADIHQAFRRWQNIKQQQEQIGQEVTDEEFPFKLLSVDLEQSNDDPTVLFVNSTIQNRSQRPVQITRGLKLPEPIDLLGSTAQQGILRQSLRNFVLTG